MPESERPPRVVPIESAARPGETPPPADVSRRLSALERQVEEALIERSGATDPAAVLRTLADEALEVYSDVRRWLAGEVRDDVSPLGELGRRLLYRLWWRVDIVGRERIPTAGPLLVVVNRAGALVPYAAFMVAEALEASGRTARPLVERSLLGLPILGPTLAAAGAGPADAGHLRAVLQAGDAAVVQPEGWNAVAKPWALRYRVAKFARGSLRVALETGTPILPVAAIGSEETQPTLARLDLAGRPLGLRALPVTPTLVPLPTKWTLWVGEPLDVAGRLDPAAGDDRRVVRALRAQVRERLQGLVSDGVRRRRGIFV